MTLFEFLATQTAWAVGVTFLLSLLVGSFLNVVIYRIPVMMEREWSLMQNPDRPLQPARFNLAIPHSSCPHCQHKIRWYENLPVISYLLLRGRCSGCQKSISARYPAIELLTALLSAFVVYQFGFTLPAAALVVLSWLLISLTFIDIDHQLLPDRLTLPLLWLGLILNTQNMFTSLESAVWGAVLGYLALWSVYWLFKLVTGKEGMGYGDFKLLAALGAWGGAQMLPLIILLSSVTGVILAVVLMALRRHQAANPLPFGPYLAIAGWIALIWGDQILHSYLMFLSGA